jgi:uncharacterized protein (DUF342 family)
VRIPDIPNFYERLTELEEEPEWTLQRKSDTKTYLRNVSMDDERLVALRKDLLAEPVTELIVKKQIKKREKEQEPMTNNLGSLNDIMFDQLKRLNNDKISKEELKEEIERSKAMAQVSTQIINTSKVVLDAERYKNDRMEPGRETPKMLEG